MACASARAATIVATTVPIRLNSCHHQYAAREERPLNWTYLANPSRMASVNASSP
jgi:hypothetical protein